MRKIYDCFKFFNELELLELRLTECYDHVDYFVIAEANKTHQGNDKIYNIEANWDRFKPFHDKIIYLKIDDMPDNHHSSWVRENFQRNALVRGISDADDNDIIIVTDCDEILRPRTLDILRNDKEHKLWICRHPMFYFKFNYLRIMPKAYFGEPMALLKRDFKGFQTLRVMKDTWPHPYDYIDKDICTIQHAGWHFTYFGDDQHIDTKLLNCDHYDGLPFVGKNKIIDMIADKTCWDGVGRSGYEYVKMDEYFPKTVLNNLDRWKDYIIPDATASIRDYLPALDMEEIYK